jgi:hypothetical protein
MQALTNSPPVVDQPRARRHAVRSLTKRNTSVNTLQTLQTVNGEQAHLKLLGDGAPHPLKCFAFAEDDKRRHSGDSSCCGDRLLSFVYINLVKLDARVILLGQFLEDGGDDL